jgi:hypothetical protein
MNFHDAFEQYQRARLQYERGEITAERFEAIVNELQVTDPAGRLWQIGVKTGRWYRMEGPDWVEDMPPAPGPVAVGPVPVYRPPVQPASIPPAAPASTRRFPVWAMAGCGFAAAALVLVGCGLMYFFGDAIFSNDLPTPASMTKSAPPATATGVTATTDSSQPGAILFQDDFSNPESGWEDIKVGSDFNTYYFQDLYHIMIGRKNFAAWATPGQSFSGDVRVEVDAGKISGSESDKYGLICHYIKNSDDTFSYYYFAMSIDGLGEIYLIDHNQASALSEHPQDMSDFIHPGDQVNHLRADCSGGKLNFYVNDQPFNGATDSSFQGGDAGLRVDSESGNSEVVFDNFVVYKP